MDEQIKLIVDSTSFGAAWEKKVLKLKEMVDHHVKEEEESDVSEEEEDSENRKKFSRGFAD